MRTVKYSGSISSFAVRSYKLRICKSQVFSTFWVHVGYDIAVRKSLEYSLIGMHAACHLNTAIDRIRPARDSLKNQGLDCASAGSLR